MATWGRLANATRGRLARRAIPIRPYKTYPIRIIFIFTCHLEDYMNRMKILHYVLENQTTSTLESALRRVQVFDIESRPSTSSACVPLAPTVTPEHVQPYPKAGERKTCNKGRRKRSSAILTDTPVKNVLEAEQMESKRKKNKSVKPFLLENNDREKKNTKRKKLQVPDSDEGEGAFCFYCIS